MPTFSSFCLLLARPRFFFRSAFSACSASIIALCVCVWGGEGVRVCVCVCGGGQESREGGVGQCNRV